MTEIMQKGKDMPEEITTLTTQEPSLVTPDAAKADPAAPAARESAVDSASEFLENTGRAIEESVERAFIRRDRIKELRANPRLQDLIAARRVDQPDAFASMSRRLGYPHASIFKMSDYLVVHLWVNGGSYQSGRSASGREAYREAWRNLRLAKVDKAALLRQNAELRDGMDALATKASDLECKVIEYQIAVAAASKVTVSTSINLAAFAPEPPDALAAITSQVAEQVMHSERAQDEALTARWDDKLTIEYLRKGLPHLTPEWLEDHGQRLLIDLTKEPHQRSAAWFGLVNAAKDGIGLVPAVASPSKSKKEGEK